MSPSTSLKTLARIIQEFRVIEPDLPVSYAAIVIFVAQHRARHDEDPSVKDISDHLGMVRPSVSRATLALSGRRLGGSKATEERPEGSRKALGLLERYADDIDLRMMRCTLSDKGRGLINRLTDHLEG